MPGHIGIRLAQRVEIAPHDREAHHLGFPGAGRQLEGVAAPCILFLGDPERCNLGVRAAEFGDQIGQAIEPAQFLEVDQRLDRFPLAEVVAEFKILARRRRTPMAPVEPVIQQMPRRVACPGIKALAPFPHGPANVLRRAGSATADDL